MDTVVTVTGNLTGDVELRTTSHGHAVATLRVASNTRRFDKEAGEFKDGDTLYINVTCWRNLGVNAAASLRKGDSVIVTGRLTYRSYDDKEGNRRSVHEIDAVSVGPDLSRWQVDVRRPARPALEAGLVAEPYPVDPLTGELASAAETTTSTEKVAAA